MTEFAIMIKFGKEKDLIELQKGYLYFNTIDYFKKADENDKGRLDIFENINSYIPNAIMNVHPHKNMQKLLYTGFVSNVTITNTAESDNFSHIWSCSHIKKGMPIRQDNKIFSEKMWEFGDHMLLIHNVGKFLEMVHKSLNTSATYAKGDSVIYLSQQQPQINNMNVFTKFNHFEYQNEYRVALKISTQMPHKLNIGSIKQISTLRHRFEVKNLVQAIDNLGLLHVLHF